MYITKIDIYIYSHTTLYINTAKLPKEYCIRSDDADGAFLLVQESFVLILTFIVASGTVCGVAGAIGFDNRSYCKQMKCCVPKP